MAFNFGGQPSDTGFSFGGADSTAGPTFNFSNLDFSPQAHGNVEEDEDDEEYDDEDDVDYEEDDEEDDEEDNWLMSTEEPMSVDDIRGTFGLEDTAIVLKLKANWVRNMDDVTKLVQKEASRCPDPPKGLQNATGPEHAKAVVRSLAHNGLAFLAFHKVEKKPAVAALAQWLQCVEEVVVELEEAEEEQDVVVLLEQWGEPSISGQSVREPGAVHEIAVSLLDHEIDDTWLYSCEESLTVEHIHEGLGIDPNEGVVVMELAATGWTGLKAVCQALDSKSPQKGKGATHTLRRIVRRLCESGVTLRIAVDEGDKLSSGLVCQLLQCIVTVTDEMDESGEEYGAVNAFLVGWLAEAINGPSLTDPRELAELPVTYWKWEPIGNSPAPPEAPPRQNGQPCTLFQAPGCPLVTAPSTQSQQTAAREEADGAAAAKETLQIEPGARYSHTWHTDKLGMGVEQVKELSGRMYIRVSKVNNADLLSNLQPKSKIVCAEAASIKFDGDTQTLDDFRHFLRTAGRPLTITLEAPSDPLDNDNANAAAESPVLTQMQSQDDAAVESQVVDNSSQSLHDAILARVQLKEYESATLLLKQLSAGGHDVTQNSSGHNYSHEWPEGDSKLGIGITGYASGQLRVSLVNRDELKSIIQVDSMIVSAVSATARFDGTEVKDFKAFLKTCGRPLTINFKAPAGDIGKQIVQILDCHLDCEGIVVLLDQLRINGVPEHVLDQYKATAQV